MQQDAPGRPSTQRIGSRPDLRVLTGIEEGDAIKLIKDATDKGTEKPKDKDGKDTEEKKVKESKDDGKDNKEKDGKDSKEKEHKDTEKHIPDMAKAPELAGHGAAKQIDDRLAGLEQAVARLAHFIGPELRPDLSSSALTEEPGGTNGAPGELLRHQAQQAKDTKD
ncbi:hypothetical protein, partial [Catellatospora chokoriensis]|uniref:hypothetical protein n=2 Tax=Catellatospora chokoriensis TaxID=310353 RepID=UPI0031CED02B